MTEYSFTTEECKLLTEMTLLATERYFNDALDCILNDDKAGYEINAKKRTDAWRMYGKLTHEFLTQGKERINKLISEVKVHEV